MKSNCIFIENITIDDFLTKQIRITVDNKYLFPAEILGKPTTYDLIFVYDSQEFTAKYRIGSKDGKSRSGVLKLDKELYLNILKIKPETIVKICKIEQNKYKIEKK